jgi:hypothetical protein
MYIDTSHSYASFPKDQKLPTGFMIEKLHNYYS